MASQIDPKLRFWRNILLGGLIQASVYLFILYVAWLIGFPITTSIILFVVVVFVCISCGIVIFGLFGSRSLNDDRNLSTYDHFKGRFDDLGGKLIDEAFGQKIYTSLYSQELSQMPCNAIDMCRELLNRKECSENRDLEFHLRIKIAKFLVKEDRYNDAIEELKVAVSMRPKDLIANFFAGENYERIGESKGAIRHYTSALNDPDAASPNIREFVESQIKRVQDKGPRKAGPQTGYRYMSH